MAKTAAITWAGPALCDDFGAVNGPDDIMEACFDDLVTEQGEGSGWKLPKPTLKSTLFKNDDVTGNSPDQDYVSEKSVLWGGNLAMLASLIGTPYMPSIKNGILFIEDIGEHPYRVERMLSQLLHARILEQQTAIIFGQFTSYKLVPNDKGYKLDTVISWLRSKLKIQILTGLPFGHVQTKVTLPVGQSVTLAIEGRDAFLLWGHQH